MNLIPLMTRFDPQTSNPKPHLQTPTIQLTHNIPKPSSPKLTHISPSTLTTSVNKMGIKPSPIKVPDLTQNQPHKHTPLPHPKSSLTNHIELHNNTLSSNKPSPRKQGECLPASLGSRIHTHGAGKRFRNPTPNHPGRTPSPLPCLR